MGVRVRLLLVLLLLTRGVSYPSVAMANVAGPSHGRFSNENRAQAPSPSKANIGVQAWLSFMVTSVVQEPPVSSL